MSQYTLRKAAAADAAPLAALINLAYRVEDFFIDGDRTDPAEVLALVIEHTFLVAEDEGGALAAAVLIEVDQAGGRGYFGMLSVDPARQGAGLGRRMVAAAEDHCRELGCRHMDLQTVSLRAELPPFYRKLGYRIVGEKPFPDIAKKKLPCHFVLMSKPL